jgi:DNA processing protein
VTGSDATGSDATAQAAAAWVAIAALEPLDMPMLGLLATAWPDPAEARRRLAARDPVLSASWPKARLDRAARTAAMSSPDAADAVAADLAAVGGRFVATDGPVFAERLVPPEWPPFVTVRGELVAAPTVAIVGMRACSAGAARFAAVLAAELAARGVTVVSGLAVGIDAAAHRGALDGGGRTVAVLAGGVDRPRPRHNEALGDEILARGGGWVSHVPPGTPTPGWRFPVRNRLIAGCADAVVVVEAARSGGSLSTAAHARRLGRPVFAVPGVPWDPRAEGTNALLAGGALVCRSADDCVVALGMARSRRRAGGAGGGDGSRPGTVTVPPVGCEPGDLLVLAAVDAVPTELDTVAQRTDLPLMAMLAAVGRLERAGAVVRPSPSTVQRVVPAAGSPPG